MDKLQEIENISYSFSQPVNETGRTLGIKGKGAGSGAFGATSGNQIFNPTRTPLTSFDIQGVDQTILDRINITSRYMIVVGDDPTDLNVKWIQRATANGQPIYLQPENGKTLHLQIGGNTDIAIQIDVADNEIIELVFNEESDITSDGGFTVVGSASGGGGVTTFAALTDTNIVGIANQDVIQWNNSNSTWDNKPFLEFGGADTADVGFLRTGNNQIIFAGRNAANTGNFEAKIDSIFNYLDLTISDNNPAGINLRAQDAVDPDQNLTIAQAGGNTGAGFISAPNAFTITADGGLGLRLDANNIDMFQDVDMNDNEINQAKFIAFSGTGGTLNLTTTAGIEYDSVSDRLLYNVPGTLDRHQFDINGELMMTILRSGSNEGTVQAENFHATGFMQIDELADFSTFDNISPSNGNIWLDSGTGLFNFHQNLTTSVLLGNPLQADLDFNTFDANSIGDLDFFQTGQSIISLPDPSGGLQYNVNDSQPQSHTFRAGGTTIAAFEGLAAGVREFNMFDHSITSVKDIAFDVAAVFAITGVTPGIGYNSSLFRMINNVPAGAGASHQWTIAGANEMLLSLTGIDAKLNVDIIDINEIQINNTLADPPAIAGIFTLNGADVKVYSGGSVRNLSNIGGGGAGDMVLADIQTVTGAKTFENEILKIRNPADTFSYTIGGKAITADRILDLPLLLADDSLLAAFTASNMTLKTIDADLNTITNIGASEIESGIILDQTPKVGPIITDEILISDSAAGGALKRVQLGNIPASPPNRIEDQDTDLVISDGVGLSFNIDGIAAATWTNTSLALTMPLDMNSEDITNVDNITGSGDATFDDLLPLDNDNSNIGEVSNEWNAIYVDQVFTNIIQAEDSGDINVFTDLDMQSGNTIDFHNDASEPVGAALGAIVIKVQGTDRLVKFYST